FAVAGLFSMATAVGVTGSVSPPVSPLPTPGQLAGAIGLGLLVSTTWAALGWTAGTLLRSATAAFAVIVLWATIVQLQLDQVVDVSGVLPGQLGAADAQHVLRVPGRVLRQVEAAGRHGVVGHHHLVVHEVVNGFRLERH